MPLGNLRRHRDILLPLAMQGLRRTPWIELRIALWLAVGMTLGASASAGLPSPGIDLVAAGAATAAFVAALGAAALTFLLSRREARETEQLQAGLEAKAQLETARAIRDVNRELEWGRSSGSRVRCAQPGGEPDPGPGLPGAS
jgi:hypothetical protein